MKESGDLEFSPTKEAGGSGKALSPLVAGNGPLDRGVMKAQCQQEFPATPCKDAHMQVRIKPQ